MTDIVKRLRSFDVFSAPMEINGIMVSPVALMAADEIVRLREERDAARAQAANADAQCERDAERAERAEAERDQLKTAAGIDEWCKQFERANITLNEKLFALHESLEKTEAERDRLLESVKLLDALWHEYHDACASQLEDNERLKGALLQIASSGVNGESLNLSRIGHAGCINVAKDALKENEHD